MYFLHSVINLIRNRTFLISLIIFTSYPQIPHCQENKLEFAFTPGIGYPQGELERILNSGFFGGIQAGWNFNPRFLLGMKFSLAQFQGKTFKEEISVPEASLSAMGSARFGLELLEISPLLQIKFGGSENIQGFIDFGGGAYRTTAKLEGRVSDPHTGTFVFKQTVKGEKTFGGISFGGGLNFKINEFLGGGFSMRFVNLILQEQEAKKIDEAFKNLKNVTFMQFAAGLIFRFGEGLSRSGEKKFTIKNRFTGQVIAEGQATNFKNFVVRNKTQLMDADLSEKDLSELNLDGADFMNANLKGTNLRKSTLIGADLRGADLEDANLEEADLWRADLTGANLKNTNLTGTKHHGLKFRPHLR